VKYFLFALLLVIFVTFCTGFWFWFQLQPVSSGTQKISFVVTKSESGDSIIRRLQTTGLIRSTIVAKIYLRLTNTSHRLKPGGYSLTPASSTPQIFAVLVSGPADIWVTIPEGWRREQIAARLGNSLTNFSAYEFNQLSATYEGQLFPDTYLLPALATPSSVLSIFLKNFTKKTNLDPTLPADRQTLILASLVEREANTDSDRLLIAGILQKRLAANWPLQVDASVQYATSTKACMATPIEVCDWWQEILDTTYPSPYNTYLNPGLPPGSISNPGLASIRAAKEPQTSSYWYYLTAPDGQTHYAATLEEHQQNIDKYLQP
jgi:UPF0755 protein